MTKMIQSLLVLVAVVCLASAVCLAQSGGEATYKAKCATCHGATGTPSAGMAKMGVKPATDPAIRKLSVAEMVASVKTNPKMKSVASLPDAQIKEAVNYYRHFLNPQPLPPGL
jgi:mono/diheme cytochrome c family protein